MVRQILVVAISLGICLKSMAEPHLCSAVFTVDSAEVKSSFFKELLLPRAVKKFDSELYWKVRTSDFSTLQLSAKESKRLEVKLALVDQVLPRGAEKWSERLMSLNLLRVRDLNSLFSKYQVRDFQDSYLRKQFITQLYTLQETPWVGFRKAVELSRNEGLQEWALRTSEQRMLNTGLGDLVRKNESGQREYFETGAVELEEGS